MKRTLKLLAAATLLLTAALPASAQTYKPDWATKMVLAKSGNDPSKTVTILAGANSSNLTLTLPAAAPGGNGYLLSATTGGVMSWVDAAASVTLAGDVTGAANANTVAKINGVTLGTGTATPSNAFMMLYNGTNSAWEGHAMSGDITIDNTGATAIGSGKVTSAMILDGTIANADVASNAAIAGTKISPDFGAQAVTTTGNISTTGSGTVTSAGLLTASAGLTAAGTVTLSGLNSAGVVHTDGSGVLSTSTIVNADVASNAAIAYSKLNLTGGIVNADVNASAAIAYSKLNLSNSIVAGDLTSGSVTSAKILDGEIVNADINASAAIAGTKISPDFGAQAVTTSGNFSTTGSGTVTSAGLMTASAGLSVTGTSTLAAVKMSQATVSTANATEDDYAIGTANSYYYLASTATSGTVVSSLAGGVDGRVIVLVNNGAKNITLLNDDGATGTAANRFKFAGVAGDNLIIAPDGVVTLVYDGTSTNHRWRLVSAQ
jgi:hypothetical protein